MTPQFEAPRRLLSENEAAKYLGVSISFLAQSRMHSNLWKGDNAYPPFVRVGRRGIRYDVQDLDTWIASRRVRG